jgi:hypothetical protein
MFDGTDMGIAIALAQFDQVERFTEVLLADLTCGLTSGKKLNPNSIPVSRFPVRRP